MNNLIDDFSPESFKLFDLTPDLVCLAGSDGYLKRVNQSVVDKLGYSREELFASPIHTFIHEQDRAFTAGNRAKLLQGEILLNLQNRYVSKNGIVIWLEWTSIFFAEKDLVLAIAKDVSAKKETEKVIHEQYQRFKNLTTYFKESIEKDRKHFAYELHEDIAQLAAAVKMNIDLATVSSPDIPAITKTHLDHALGTASLLLKTIQKISFSISPYMLEEFGLNVTIDWLCKEFKTMNSIVCAFETDYEEACLTREMQIDFFRICQEALDNVLLHAHAGKVKISITEKASLIYLCIQDDGKGFKKSALIKKHGLTGIEERAASLHGTLQIKSTPGKGSIFTVVVPKPVY